MVGAGNVSYTNYVDQRRQQNERQAAADRALSAERSRAAVCAVVQLQAEVFRESTTKIGQDAYSAWTLLGQRFGCQ